MHTLLKGILILMLISILVTKEGKSFEKTSNTKITNLRTASVNSFTKQIYQNFGPSYTSHVEELLGILHGPEKVSLPEKESSFLEFDVLKMKVTADKALAVKINNGDAVSAKDKYKISFTPRIDCFIYILKVDAIGVISPLFPQKRFSRQTNPLMANLTYFVPPMKKWLSFERNYGEEAIIIFASKKRNPHVERLMEYFDDSVTITQLSKQKNVKRIDEIPRIYTGTGSIRESEIRKVRLPFDEFGEFISTEFTWKGSEITITLWYKLK